MRYMQMIRQPTIISERLVLRPFRLDDVPVVTKLAGDAVIAGTTLRIPHPYRELDAEKWIKTHALGFRKRDFVVFAVVRRVREALIGAIELTLDIPNERAELGYWIGRRYWNRGYATEAAGSLLMYGFVELGLNRIHAHHLVSNTASGKVLEKIGMKREGFLRQHVRKWDSFEDIVLYGMVRDDFQTS